MKITRERDKNQTFNHIGLKPSQTWHRTGNDYVFAKCVWNHSVMRRFQSKAKMIWIWMGLSPKSSQSMHLCFGWLRPLDGIFIVAFNFIQMGNCLGSNAPKNGTSTCVISFNWFFIHFEPDTDTHLDADIFSISIQRRRCPKSASSHYVKHRRSVARQTFRQEWVVFPWSIFVLCQCENERKKKKTTSRASIGNRCG